MILPVNNRQGIIGHTRNMYNGIALTFRRFRRYSRAILHQLNIIERNRPSLPAILLFGQSDIWWGTLSRRGIQHGIRRVNCS